MSKPTRARFVAQTKGDTVKITVVDPASGRVMDTGLTAPRGREGDVVRHVKETFERHGSRTDVVEH